MVKDDNEFEVWMNNRLRSWIWGRIFGFLGKTIQGEVLLSKINFATQLTIFDTLHDNDAYINTGSRVRRALRDLVVWKVNNLSRENSLFPPDGFFSNFEILLVEFVRVCS